MKVVVPHHKTQAEAKQVIDRTSNELLGMAGPVKIVDQKKNWIDSVMQFSFVAKYGFISVPINGTVTVNEQDVTVDCELPGMVKQFIGEDKVQAGIEKRLGGLLA